MKIKPKVVPRFPRNLLVPVGNLQNKLRDLKEKDISTEDPFKDPSRTIGNAATDTEAEEQYGHARTSSIKDRNK